MWLTYTGEYVPIEESLGWTQSGQPTPGYNIGIYQRYPRIDPGDRASVGRSLRWEDGSATYRPIGSEQGQRSDTTGNRIQTRGVGGYQRRSKADVWGRLRCIIVQRWGSTAWFRS